MSIPSTPRAIVTGAGSGLGRAFVLELAARPGARLLCADIDEASAKATADQARLLGAETHAALCDVADFTQVDRLAQEADDRFGGVDVMVNNAGVAVGGDMGTVPLEDWQWIVSINLMGVVHGCHLFAPRFKKQKRGHIINVSSAAGLVASASLAPYNATKFAVVGLSEALYLEMRPHGVGVTVVCPTFFPTAIADRARGTQDERLKLMVKKLMSASKLDANDVARSALQSADDDQLYSVPMNDGRLMWALKRMAPEQWHARIGPFVYKMAAKKFG